MPTVSSQIPTEQVIETVEASVPEPIEETQISTESTLPQKYLNTIFMTELFGTPFETKHPIVEGMLYRGTYYPESALPRAAFERNCCWSHSLPKKNEAKHRPLRGG